MFHLRRLNRGIGIEVLKDLPSIQAFLTGKALKAASAVGGGPPGANTWVIQKYIENPVSAIDCSYGLCLSQLLIMHFDPYRIKVFVTPGI